MDKEEKWINVPEYLFIRGITQPDITGALFDEIIQRYVFGNHWPIFREEPGFHDRNHVACLRWTAAEQERLEAGMHPNHWDVDWSATDTDTIEDVQEGENEEDQDSDDLLNFTIQEVLEDLQNDDLIVSSDGE